MQLVSIEDQTARLRDRGSRKQRASLVRGIMVATACATLALIGACGGDTTSPPKVDGGSLVVTITGLPAGVEASVLVSGPAGYSRSLAATRTLEGLEPGGYTVTATTVTPGDQIFTASPDSQTVSVTTSATSAKVTVTYTPVTGDLTVQATGLPAGVDAAIAVSGPGGFSQGLTGTQTLEDIPVGTYTVTASPVSAAGDYYTPDVASQDVLVTEASVATAAVVYSHAGTVTLNLAIDGLYAVQSTQTYAGTVPLVQGRDACLRVFVTADGPNTAEPEVRVRLYAGATLITTETISAVVSAVPTSVDEGDLAASWNLVIPGNLIQPGRSLLADVDPAGLVPETDEGDNLFPASGTPLPLDVRPLPSLDLTFVPVHQSTIGETGDVDAGNAPDFFAATRRMLPVGTHDLAIRSVYTTSVVAEANGNGWGTILSELLALRNLTDHSSRHYYGVVHTTYGSGVAGIGYVSATPSDEYLAALGWDSPGSRAETMAHEVGHNFGRTHAPCGTPNGVDPEYPYADASIGVYGLDVESLGLKAPDSHKDLMGYCAPRWLSDYTFEGILDFRAAIPGKALEIRSAPVTCQLVWGRITSDGIVLEPGFQIEAVPVLPERAGPYWLELLAEDGTSLASHTFAGCEVADLPGGPETHFAFLVPVAEKDVPRLATILVSGAGQPAIRHATAVLAGAAGLPDAAARVVAADGGRVRIDWNPELCPMVMVRDPDGGDVLSLARGGSVNLPAPTGGLELIPSDGVRGLPARIRFTDR